jgi:hypothetical protein
VRAIAFILLLSVMLPLLSCSFFLSPERDHDTLVVTAWQARSFSST